jgi:alkylhydroperoxidase family enzyme
MAAVGADVLTQNWTAYRHTVLEGLLPRQLKEMIGLVVTRAARSPYGVELHKLALAHLGVAPEMIDNLAVYGDAAHLTLRERAMLRFAEGYAGSGDDVSLPALEAMGFTDEEVAEVVDTVLLTEALCRFARESGLSGEEL